MAEQAATFKVLRQVGETMIIETKPDTTDRYATAVELPARYRFDFIPTFPG